MKDYNKRRICPDCGNSYYGYPAVSRHDNKTLICPRCGEREAMEDYYQNIKRAKETNNG